jgi:hypothetical protein
MSQYGILKYGGPVLLLIVGVIGYAEWQRYSDLQPVQRDGTVAYGDHCHWLDRGRTWYYHEPHDPMLKCDNMGFMHLFCPDGQTVATLDLAGKLTCKPVPVFAFQPTQDSGSEALQCTPGTAGKMQRQPNGDIYFCNADGALRILTEQAMLQFFKESFEGCLCEKPVAEGEVSHCNEMSTCIRTPHGCMCEPAQTQE